MTIHVTPIPSTIELTTPAFTMGTTNTAGAGVAAVAADSTLLVFDTTVPTDISTSTVSASAGTATVTSRRDHVHGSTAVSTVPSAATQAELEAASSTSTYTSPGRQQYHPTAGKMWCSIESSGTLESPSYNVASVGDTGTGNRDINFTTAFSTDTFPSWAAFTVGDQGVNCYIVAVMNSTGDMNLIVRTDSGGLEDAATAQGSFGDQA